MARKVLTSVSAILACLALLCLFYSFREETILIFRFPPRDNLRMHLWFGRVDVLHDHYNSDVLDNADWVRERRSLDLSRNVVFKKDLYFGFGFHWRKTTYNAGDYWSRISFPLWFPVIVFRMYPTIILIRRLRRRRGHCLKCDYNLGGNLSGVCPECGTPILAKA